jgi:DNA-binding beta-propeller fold protein YncE
MSPIPGRRRRRGVQWFRECNKLPNIRHLVFIGSLAVVLAGCSGQAAPTATPDLFSNVAQESDQAYAQGMELYQAGRFAEAQTAFNRARLLSPNPDARIEEMIQRTNQRLTPSPTAAPATDTPTPEPSPLAINSATPSVDFGTAYFGRSFLSVVPGRSGAAVPMTRFSTQDQLGLYIEKLDERLHLAFSLRVFDSDSGAVVANTGSDAVQRIVDDFVWYHTGGEPLGRFHLELYAGDVLANTVDYVVGTEPVAILTSEVVATPTSPVVSPGRPVSQSTATPAAPATSPAPAPTPTPTPAVTTATRINVPGGPSALAYDEVSDQLFVADRSGLVWSIQHGQPTLTRPYAVGGEPVGLALDPVSQRLYVAVRGQPALIVLDAANGKQVSSALLPEDPGDILLTQDLVYVVLPRTGAIQTIDARDLSTVRVTPELPHVTGLHLDEAHQELYVSQLEGQISAVDASTGEVTGRWTVSSSGLAGLTVANDRIVAVNAAEHTLIQLDPATGDVQRTDLSVEPGAVVVGPRSGAMYVLGVDANAVVRWDGARAALADDGPAVASDLGPDTVWIRPRMLVSATDEHVFVIEPEAALLALVSFQ